MRVFAVQVEWEGGGKRSGSLVLWLQDDFHQFQNYYEHQIGTVSEWCLAICFQVELFTE